MKKAREKTDGSLVLVLVAGAILPDWLLSNTAVIVKDGIIKRKDLNDDSMDVKVRLVELPPESEAIFAPHGRVLVRFPGQIQYNPVLESLQVMEIRRSREVEYNRLLCPNCMDFTAKVISRYRPKIGGEKVRFHCHKCRHEWDNLDGSRSAA